MPEQQPECKYRTASPDYLAHPCGVADCEACQREPVRRAAPGRHYLVTSGGLLAVVEAGSRTKALRRALAEAPAGTRLGSLVLVAELAAEPWYTETRAALEAAGVATIPLGPDGRGSASPAEAAAAWADAPGLGHGKAKEGRQAGQDRKG
jgi:hypothetical protein